METDGIKFYRKAADQTSHPLGKEMFLSFRKDEERHLKVLKEILVDLDFSGFEKYFEDTPGEKIKTVFAQVKAEIEERISVSPDEMEALRIGMNMEEESVRFYENALQETENRGAKALLTKLVVEEKDHYRILNDTHSFLKDSGEWFLWEERGLLDGG